MAAESPFPKETEAALRRRIKVELRKRMRSVRNTAPLAACAERSARIVERLMGLEVVARAASVALFFPLQERREVDLRSLDGALRARGVRLAYPAIDSETGAMRFAFVAALEDLADRGMGFPEPAAAAEDAGALDVIVVPALAVDPRGHRIGYGAGFYDRTLPRYAPPAVTVAVAFDYQLVVEVPDGEGDVPVHWVVTDGRVLRAEP